jgi:hypothetical protein
MRKGGFKSGSGDGERLNSSAQFFVAFQRLLL